MDMKAAETYGRGRNELSPLSEEFLLLLLLGKNRDLRNASEERLISLKFDFR